MKYRGAIAKLSEQCWEEITKGNAYPASQAKCSRSTLQLLREARCVCAQRRPVLSHSALQDWPGDPSTTVKTSGIGGVGGAAVFGFPAIPDEHTRYNLQGHIKRRKFSTGTGSL